MPASQGMTSHTLERCSMPPEVRITHYLTHLPSISPDSAERRHDIDDAADNLVLENNDEEEFYSGSGQAARADRGQRGAGAAEPFKR